MQREVWILSAERCADCWVQAFNSYFPLPGGPPIPEACPRAPGRDPPLPSSNTVLPLPWFESSQHPWEGGGASPLPHSVPRDTETQVAQPVAVRAGARTPSPPCTTGWPCFIRFHVVLQGAPSPENTRAQDLVELGSEFPGTRATGPPERER